MSASTKRAARTPLTRERLVECALALARRDGIAGVSMRKLASELGVEAMSLYHHVPNKAALLVLMAERSLSELPAQDPTRPWDERLVELLIGTYRAGVDNPAVLQVLTSDVAGRSGAQASDPGSAVASIGLLETLLGLLAEASLPLQHRARVYRGLIGVVVGFIAVQVGGLAVFGQGDIKAHPDVRPPPEAPLLSAIAPSLEQEDPVAALGFTVALFVQGIQSLPGN